MKKSFSIVEFVALVLFISVGACASDDLIPPDINEPSVGFISEVDSSTFNIGIPIYNADQGKEFSTEFNSEIRPYWTADARGIFYRQHQNNNPYLKCVSEAGAGNFGVRLALYKTLFDDDPLPRQIAERVTGLSFNAYGHMDNSLTVRVLDVSGNVLAEQVFPLEAMKIKTYSLNFESTLAKEIIFFSSTNGLQDSTQFGLDDIYLKTNDARPYSPPADDAAFLGWLKRSSFNFFDWNYVALPGDKGVVMESHTDAGKVSLSGIGYAYPIFTIAAEDGYISAEEAKSRVKAMLKWQLDQNWFDGSGGWHGFPHHYFKKDGTYYWADVSTIDWAICAAGIRVAKQYYSNDAAIVSMAETLLARPDWSAALAADDKIAMGFNGLNGVMNNYRWALAFSEETELVYLEAVASGDLPASIFETIIREKKSDFYPSWFGAGFTYNWLQLWTGAIEPYKTNSIAAFQNDASTSQNAFSRPLMGLTACSTIKEAREKGFLNWGMYISNQGGSVRGTSGSVVQISPAAYGAALALPFTYSKSITALREFVKMGYYHEYLGLPDNVRMNNLPEGITQSPNWDTYDINIGPIILAIEQVHNNKIGTLYLSDAQVMDALTQLKESFPK
ncbi:MAG: hypothetical protein RIR11_4490 [Bacteroidota bacterium]|jgi:hypothetical protein